MKHFIFDLDETLVDTSELKNYMKTQYGREHVEQNIKDLPTRIYDHALLDLVKSLNKKNKVSIVTNSPQGYAEAVLKKHNFPDSLKIYSNAQKPLPNKLLQVCGKEEITPNEILVIEDSAKGIVATHEAKMPSVAVTWGNESSLKQLKKAEPQKIITDPKDLEDIIIEFEKGKINYQGNPSYNNLNLINTRNIPTLKEKISLKVLGKYYPSWGYGNELTKWYVMAYKRSKEVSSEEIKNGATDDFFYNGKLNKGVKFSYVFDHFRREISKGIKELEIKGTTMIIAAPNSNPDFCYKTDTNQVLINENLQTEKCNIPKERMVKRTRPLPPAHSYGRILEIEQFRTMGLDMITNETEPENIIVYDDIKTKGIQIMSMVKLLKTKYPKTKYYALALGETVN